MKSVDSSGSERNPKLYRKIEEDNLDSLMLRISEKTFTKIKDYSQREKTLYLSGYMDALQDFKEVDTDLMYELIYDKKRKEN